MGINNLNNFLRKNCPEVFEEIHISEYAYKKVAIDTSLFLCKFKAICGPRWLDSFLRLVSCLRRNEIHCVFIYDFGAPPEKAEERAERRRQQEKMKQKVITLETSLENYYNTGDFDSNLIELYEKEKNKPVHKSLLRIKKDVDVDIDVILKRIDKMRSNILDISQDDFNLTKKLFKILNIPFFDAPMEAETCCSDLCKRGIVDAVLSEDTDVLAYSTPVFLTKIDTINDTTVRIKHADILESLEITKEQFLDLCIMHGCDYNKNIPKVGSETSFKYIKKYGSIEEIASNTKHDITILNHVRSRELFKNYEEINLKSIPFCGTPDFLALETFIIENNLNINIQKLKKDFTHNIIVVEDEEDVILEEQKVEINSPKNNSLLRKMLKEKQEEKQEEKEEDIDHTELLETNQEEEIDNTELSNSVEINKTEEEELIEYVIEDEDE
jgi:5'-3' exonuclease